MVAKGSPVKMFNCPIRNETCVRKLCYFWVNSNCAILQIHNRLNDVVEKLDKLEEKIEKRGQDEEIN